MGQLWESQSFLIPRRSGSRQHALTPKVHVQDWYKVLRSIHRLSAVCSAQGVRWPHLTPTGRCLKSASTWVVGFPTLVGDTTIDSDIDFGIPHLHYYKSLGSSKRK